MNFFLINIFLLCTFKVFLGYCNLDDTRKWYSTGTAIAVPPSKNSGSGFKTAIDFCQLPVDIGKCDQQLIRYYYDAKIDDCKRFTFSGCGGNSNRFMRRAHCRNRCVKNEENEDAKQHRRTLTTTESSTTTSTVVTTKLEPILELVTKSLPVKRRENLSSGMCTGCDPLFGTCNNGVCGCMKGFRSLGKVCIDLNECDNGAICGDNARCVNTVGSYTCECDSGFQVDGKCKIGPEACQDEFDVNLTEEDCNQGKQEIRYYYDSDSAKCKQFFYGGCKTRSRNFFADLQTCDVLCASLQRDYLEHHHYKIDLLSSPASIAQPDKPLSVEDWPLRPVTVTPHAPLNLDFGPTPGKSQVEKEEEAKNAVGLVEALTPGMDICQSAFDATLREECLSADWVERFWWNPEFSDCEPFWYDNSCDPRDRAAKNFFESFEKCKSSCSGKAKSKQEEPPATTEAVYVLPTDAPAEALPLKSEEVVTATAEPAAPENENEKEEEPDDPNFVPVDKWEGVLDDERVPAPTPKVEKVEIVHRDPEEAVTTTTTTTTIATPLSCQIPFDENLRNECKTGDWQELFFFSHSGECEAFWHDSSCGELNFTGDLNLFKTFEDCKSKCSEVAPTEHIETTTGIMSTLPYKQDDPLKIIFANAIKPDESSLLPDKLPAKYELNFAQKENSDGKATTKFDRLKYMAEFRKRLFALPEGFATSPVTTEMTTTSKMLEEKVATTSEIPTTTKAVEKVQISTTTDFSAYIEGEKRKVEETLKKLDAPADLCDEPLHPKLEEDCKGDQWEIRWFFNTDRGACKSFWYGGCEVESRNFFPDHANCRHTCAHKYQATKSFSPKTAIPPGDLTTAPPFRKDRLTTSLKLTYPHSEDLFPSQENVYVDHVVELDGSYRAPIAGTRPPPTTSLPPKTLAKVSEGATSSSEPWFYSHIDKVILDLKAGEHPGFQKPEEFVRRVEAASNDFVKYDIGRPEVTEILSPGGTSRSINDACDDEYDPKWDEDCLGDEWVIRSYWNSTTKSCKSFWYGGCQTSSRNIWFDRDACQIACKHKLGKVDESPITQADIEATIASSTKKREITGDEFKQNLDQHFADIKRAHENREDLKYSKMLDHPVTVAAECLEPFNSSLTKPCNGGQKWMNRFYYDKDSRSCRMYWSEDGCLGVAKNNFDDLETCQWKCEGRHPQPHGKSCLDKFDTTYLEDCRHGEFTNRFYFDHDRKKCVAFHWGGCQSKSQNFFTDMTLCQDLCESPPRELTQACLQPFDKKYEDSCSATERHQQYYYFDSISGICKMFWFGNCKGDNQNIFSTLESCQWICERGREERKPAMCADKFDQKYTESCGDGKWIEKWYFDQSSGECHEFWWDGCVSPSQNIFPDQKSCTANCQHPGFEISSSLVASPEDSKFRCLEPVEIGSCQETYPAFYYDKSAKTCRPFAYSGCGGNYNRFLTLSQCENLCYAFNSMNEAEVDCHLPLHIGYGKNDESCIAQAGFRFYYDRSYGKCSQMWYLGCGGNANNFYSYDTCQRTCSLSHIPRELERKPRASSEDCFEAPGDKGTCSKNATGTTALSRWTYQSGVCTKFSYSGCGGNRNRFATQDLCKKTCADLKKSNDPRICSFQPDVGPCNQLRYQWYYNQTRGSCNEFLYGGCGGNPNRFDTYEICQKACETTGKDPCFDKLDRGKWCGSLSNAYYYNVKKKKCQGFHYTGCGKSENRFLLLEECQQKCERRHAREARPAAALPPANKKGAKPKVAETYSGSKPITKTPMLRHINLNGFNQTYYKSDAQWMDYNICYGYRYNVSGVSTKLNVHLCVLGGSNDCISETYGTTNGEEFCNVMRPFLRGPHLYSWYFGIDAVSPKYILNQPETGWIQRKNDTMAAILILKANNCHDVC